MEHSGGKLMPGTETENKHQKTILGPCALVFCSALTGTWRVVRPFVDPGQCVHCGICQKHCPTGVMVTGEKGDEIAVAIDFTYCKGCGICANVCPQKAITMIDERKV
jgi:2-oxoacid:acceptor oxidoreductase delta subunit (pyruvate/2-ketoisovalerate family)